MHFSLSQKILFIFADEILRVIYDRKIAIQELIWSQRSLSSKCSIQDPIYRITTFCDRLQPCRISSGQKCIIYQAGTEKFLFLRILNSKIKIIRLPDFFTQKCKIHILSRKLVWSNQEDRIIGSEDFSKWCIWHSVSKCMDAPPLPHIGDRVCSDPFDKKGWSILKIANEKDISRCYVPLYSSESLRVRRFLRGANGIWLQK